METLESPRGPESPAARVVAFALVSLLAACAAPPPKVTPSEGRALIERHLPAKLADKEGWAEDIYTPMTVIGIPLNAQNVCAVVAITEQESGFRADPAVPGLPKIAWAEIERRRERLGIPRLVLDAALSLESSNGKTYRERIDGVRTERDMSDIYEDFIARVPLGRRFLEDRNPVRTGGPMQVSVVFAREYAHERPYPYAVTDSIRDEVFGRRGGMYFGIAHLLDYPAPYGGDDIYRFADFNAGRYTSRNAAFQNALARLTGRKLALDGDVLPRDPDAPPGETAAAALSAARTLGLDADAVRHDLALGKRPEFEGTALYRRVFEAADARAGRALPRAMLPVIEVRSPKFSHRLTTAGFARRVAARQRECLARR